MNNTILTDLGKINILGSVVSLRVRTKADISIEKVEELRKSIEKHLNSIAKNLNTEKDFANFKNKYLELFNTGNNENSKTVEKVQKFKEKLKETVNKSHIDSKQLVSAESCQKPERHLTRNFPTIDLADNSSTAKTAVEYSMINPQGPLANISPLEPIDPKALPGARKDNIPTRYQLACQIVEYEGKRQGLITPEETLASVIYRGGKEAKKLQETILGIWQSLPRFQDYKHEITIQIAGKDRTFTTVDRFARNSTNAGLQYREGDKVITVQGSLSASHNRLATTPTMARKIEDASNSIEVMGKDGLPYQVGPSIGYAGRVGIPFLNPQKIEDRNFLKKLFKGSKKADEALTPLLEKKWDDLNPVLKDGVWEVSFNTKNKSLYNKCVKETVGSFVFIKDNQTLRVRLVPMPVNTIMAEDEVRTVFLGEIDLYESKRKDLAKGISVNNGVYELEVAVQSLLSMKGGQKKTFKEEVAAYQALIEKTKGKPLEILHPLNGKTYKVKLKSAVIVANQFNTLLTVDKLIASHHSGEESVRKFNLTADVQFRELVLKRAPLRDTQQVLAIFEALPYLKAWEQVLARQYLCLLANIPLVTHCKSSVDRTGIAVALSAALYQWRSAGQQVPYKIWEMPNHPQAGEPFRELVLMNWLKGLKTAEYSRGVKNRGFKLNQPKPGFRDFSLSPVLRDVLPKDIFETPRYKMYLTSHLIHGIGGAFFGGLAIAIGAVGLVAAPLYAAYKRKPRLITRFYKDLGETVYKLVKNLGSVFRQPSFKEDGNDPKDPNASRPLIYKAGSVDLSEVSRHVAG